MPQIEQLLLVYQSQWFWLLLVIGVIYFVIAKGMAPKIEATIDARDGKIAEDLAGAMRARTAADETEESVRLAAVEARAGALTITAQAKSRAAQDKEKRVAQADSDIVQMVADTEAKLSAARDAALANVESVAADAAQAIVSKLTGTTIGAAAATNAVKAVLING